MNKYLEQLVELSNIDKDIDDFTPRLEKVQSVLKATKDEQAAILSQIEDATTSVTELKNQKSQTNAHIAEFSAKIKDVAKKSGAAKTEKEIKALQLEDELAKEQLEAANEEVERLEKIIDSKNALKSELDEIVGNLQAGQDEIMMAMDMMQYQDIHRQKIERVINVMRALSKYMNTLFEGKIDDDKRVSSAVHIAGDTTTENLVSNDDIEALIESLGKK